MSAYLYQTKTLTEGETYQFSFDYAADADIADGTLMFAGLSAIADLALQTDVNALPNAVTADFAVVANESGTKTFELVAAAGQNALFLTNILTGAGTITFDNVSLKATTSITGEGYLENTTIYPINLSNVENQSSIFLWTYLPSGADFDSLTLRFGSSPTDYWFLTVYKNQQGNAFVNGWNLLQFEWSKASQIGSPDSSSISYVRVTWNYNGELQTGVHLNGINSILGTILAYEYYSKFLFRDAITGAFQETVTDDSNLINLDTESYNLLFNQVAYLAGQQQQGLDATFYDGNFFKNAYDQGIIKYKSMYKSEIQKPQSSYYQPSKPGYGRYLGR